MEHSQDADIEESLRTWQVAVNILDKQLRFTKCSPPVWGYAGGLWTNNPSP